MQRVFDAPRLISAMLLAPIIAMALTSVMLLVVMQFSEQQIALPAGGNMVVAIPMVLGYGVLFGALLGWPTMFTGGLIAHAVLRQINRRKFWPYVAMSAPIGALAATIGVQSLLGELGNGLVLPVGALAGAFTGAIFWLIRRPDRS